MFHDPNKISLFLLLAVFAGTTCGCLGDSDDPTPAPTDITGTWRGTFTSPDTSVDGMMRFDQQQDTVTGDGSFLLYAGMFDLTGTYSDGIANLTFTSRGEVIGEGILRFAGNSAAGTVTLHGTQFRTTLAREQ